MQQHTYILAQVGYAVTLMAGRGDNTELAPGTKFKLIEAMDSQNPRIEQLNVNLEKGKVPDNFDNLTAQLKETLATELQNFDDVIIHNIFTKHFNLPLTAALFQLLDENVIHNCIAWCHDFTWTSPSSRSKVHHGYPWDLLRTYRPDVTYVVVSKQRQLSLADLLDCPPEKIQVIYNGVNTQQLLGLTEEGESLIKRMHLLDADLILLMPVRVTHAKNFEYAFKTVAELKNRGVQVKMVITGPPDPHDADSIAYFRSLQEMRDDLGITDQARFIYESGSNPNEPFYIDNLLVGDLFRISDIMFMPSHREGFGMPVLEAGLVGIPVVSTRVPAAVEIAPDEAILFDADTSAEELATRILDWANENRVHRLRRRIRQQYTWEAIFRRDIEPLLNS